MAEPDKARVRVDSSIGDVVVSGTPVLSGIEGRPSNTPEGGFVFEVFGDTLLAASSGEFNYIHFGVVLTDVELVVPSGITVIREQMPLNGDKEPDRRPPGSPPRPAGR